MKKSLLLLVMLLCSIGQGVAQTLIDGIYYELDSASGTASVTFDYSDELYYSGSISIPNTVVSSGTTYSVTSIGDWAFSGCSGLTSIKIPNSVTSIGDYAFFGCSGLTSIKIPNSVTSIGNEAFVSCSGLASIEIPNSVTSIGDKAFWDCTGLASATIGNSVTSIGTWAFHNCGGLTSIEIPNSVTSIGLGAFSDCRGLTSIVVKTGNTYYDSRNTCNAIIETSTGTLIAGCNNTVIPNSVKSIGYEAFRGCWGSTSIEIPNSVTSIGVYAFALCGRLTNIKMMPSIPPATGHGLFLYTNLTTIYVPKGAKEAYNVEPWNSYEIVEMENTGIAAAPTIDNQTVAAPVYDLNGRCVGTTNAISTLPKGVYIVNGKKILR